MRKYLLILIIVFSFVLNVAALGVLIQVANNNSIESNTRLVDQKFPLNAITQLNLSSTATPSQQSSSPNTSNSTYELFISDVLTNLTERTMTVTVSNNHNSQITLANITVNGFPATFEDGIVIPANSNMDLTLKFAEGIIFGDTYEINILSSEGYSAAFYEIVC